MNREKQTKCQRASYEQYDRRKQPKGTSLYLYEVPGTWYDSRIVVLRVVD